MPGAITAANYPNRQHTLLKALSYICVLATLTAGVNRASNVPYEIGTWRGFRPAAMSYTFDDGCSNQFSVAIPMFDAKGFKLTLFTVTSTMFPGWPKLQSAASNGHEIASHTMTHTRLATLSDEEQIKELKNSRDAINANIPGQKCVTMAYPYCVEGKDSLTSQYYMAARTCSQQLVPSTPANWMNISSFVCGSLGSVKTVQDFNARADSAAASKAWCVYLLHGIDNDGGYSPVTTSTLHGGLDYLAANRDKFWVDTFGNVVRYILERNAASVTETANTKDRITLSLTDSLDGSVFNYPITLRRPLPQGWSAASVSQKHKALPAQIVSVNSTNYVMFDVVPNGGDIILSKSDVAPVLINPPRTNATSFNFRLNDQIGIRDPIEPSTSLASPSSVQANIPATTSGNFSIAASSRLP
jgi:oligosaccharide reducing-end xylanase